MKELNKNELKKIDGGRYVVKIDLDGDGSWDAKYIYHNDGTYTIKLRDAAL
ncbi:bacteriocin [Prolixibacter sp. SD074]|jgi:bacteriocin-like protein|uniref:bacteriocin n=1 Tax=Prolixibacter sp. SD074 TaxID=2652391 RepID=UPI00127F837F|nr:bacteriocin [Prolixibacter sp. SD074]GET29921.1 hypothetical protein SD074_21230 [Prolixibacter sp. SD074]